MMTLPGIAGEGDRTRSVWWRGDPAGCGAWRHTPPPPASPTVPFRPRRAGRTFALALLLSGCAGGVHKLVPDMPVRIGRPYNAAGRTWVPADDPRYDTIGEASWYGSSEQGRPTASGERFDRRRVSAAHPTLPLPSYVDVTRLDTGTRMIVRINDRGPYARDRIIDLSREAARRLGIDRAGHALVRVRRVTPTRAQADALRRGYPVMLASVTPTASPLGRGPEPRPRQPGPILGSEAPPVPLALYVLIAVPSDPDAADALASGLASESAHVIAAAGGYQVVAGPYPDLATRAAALARLRARGYPGVVALDASPETRDLNGSALP